MVNFIRKRLVEARGGACGRACRGVALAALVGWLAQPLRADFGNPGEWDNGGDLRAVRRAVAGVEGADAVPVPPVNGDDPSNLLAEMRAQSLMMENIGKLVAMLCGIALFRVTVLNVKITV